MSERESILQQAREACLRRDYSKAYDLYQALLLQTYLDDPQVSHLEHLPPEALVEALKLAFMIHSHTRDVLSQEPSNVQWQDPFGAWSDLPDTMLDDLDQLRHANQPTPPLELL